MILNVSFDNVSLELYLQGDVKTEPEPEQLCSALWKLSICKKYVKTEYQARCQPPLDKI